MNLHDKMIELGINADTKKIELKLRAIASFAKHCEVLADELKRIDEMISCPSCGSCDVCAMHADGRLEHASCNECGHELPTRLEGSD